MSEVIFKYFVPMEDSFELELPDKVNSCLLAEQHNNLCVWFQLDPQAYKYKRTFHLRGTGQPLPDDRELQHIGSSLCGDGYLVWHLFLDLGPVLTGDLNDE